MNDKPQISDDDATLSSLLNLAGPTDQIAGDVEKRVYASVKNEWSQSNGAGRITRWGVPMALAATVLLAFFMNQSNVPVESRSIGNILGSGNDVFVGDVIDTRVDGGLSLWLNGDISLRVDEQTVLKVAAEDEFTLMAGRIYIDTGDRIYSDRHVAIHTASGSAIDVGTQFSVSYDHADMSVAVREGRVDLSDGEQTHSAEQGQKLTLRPGRSAELDSVPIAGPEWEWAIALAPDFVLQEHSLLDFLKWASRETGMELEFDSDDVRSAARIAQPYGSIEGLSPLQAVEAVLATTQLRYTIKGDTISISK